MRLEQLLDGAQAFGASAPAGAGAVDLTGLAYDSRQVHGGELFFCVTGFQHDGHEFAPSAVRAGARALVVERPLELGVPEVLVPSVRAAMAPLAARFFGNPSRELKVVGVTGTNGKTTTTFLLRSLLERAGGYGCGLLGTVKSVIAGEDRPVERTTPEAIDLQSDLRAMLDGGDRACAMEVSSHALELGRADAIEFAAAVFTNLTQDHLDFHPTMEDYFRSKRLLFRPAAGEPPARSIVNVGDPYGRRLADELGDAVTFAIDAEADYAAERIRCEPGRSSFTLSAEGRRRELELPLPGRFNVANALGALAAARALGIELEPLLAALEHGVSVPGRLEPVDEGQGFAVLVDYAHTPDSLANVLEAAREMTAGAPGASGRVVCVFGAGGDRDRAKRPLMGEIAARLADFVIVTSDNPRSEDPERIIAEIMAGVPGGGAGGVPGGGAGGGPGGGVSTEVDRRAAIGRALAAAAPGDVVVIAGKGHEQGQELAGGRKLPFDDVTVAREALRADARPLEGVRSG
ncbi:MAG TPA: UDP-N-acetylmuramoyl-L-alanyl-D-glutamate--2,6-diaminopimelate ligase [Solirubrobacteraceae bacterium]|nr:UDP-N-acetylmuramoyl-L-alanyl-D-glutamate--2,6-diaminopimelate ligase [Solirubrobacteraceae bacterium]